MGLLTRPTEGYSNGNTDAPRAFMNFLGLSTELPPGTPEDPIDLPPNSGGYGALVYTHH